MGVEAWLVQSLTKQDVYLVASLVLGFINMALLFRVLRRLDRGNTR